MSAAFHELGRMTRACADVCQHGCMWISCGFYRIWVLFLNTDGTVKGYQKISDTQGGFGGTLYNLDYFGDSLACVGDLDSDGTQDVVVGASGDDDGGTDRSAVWILFLNTGGTVKSYLKISALQGGFGGTLDDGDNFGKYVALVGDLDGDEAVNVAIGARMDDDGGTDTGALWILEIGSPTPSPSTTPTASPTSSPTPSSTMTPSNSPTPSPSITPTPTPSTTNSPTPTPSATPSISPTPSNSPTPSGTSSPTPSQTPSSTPTPTSSVSPSSMPSATPSSAPLFLAAGEPAIGTIVIQGSKEQIYGSRVAQLSFDSTFPLALLALTGLPEDKASRIEVIGVFDGPVEGTARVAFTIAAESSGDDWPALTILNLIDEKFTSANTNAVEVGNVVFLPEYGAHESAQCKCDPNVWIALDDPNATCPSP